MTRLATKTGSDSNHANHALQRTRLGRRGCNCCIACAGSLSLVVRPLGHTVDNLFQFSRHKSQRRRKQRGALQRALRAVAIPTAYDRVLGPDDWFHCWHQHLDWDGLGDLSPRLRRIFLEGHARLFRHLALQAHRLGKPYQIWIVLLVDDAGQDAAYLHTANPHSAFPTQFPEVQWGLSELVALFTPWLPDFSLVAGRAGGALFLFAEGYGVSLKQ
jgi:hypothetical protein